VYQRCDQAEATAKAHQLSDLARKGRLLEAARQEERRTLKKMKRYASLKRTPSHVEERKIMKALERVSAEQTGIHPADAALAEENLSEPESEVVSDNEVERSKIAGMSLKDRRALWESTLPQKSSILPVRIRSDHDLTKLASDTWIEIDKTPTIPYGTAGKKPGKPAKSNTVKLPW
jgi:hypothetical protein